LEDLRAGDICGHEVRRKLDALELEVKNPRDGFDQQGLGQTRRARN